MSIDKYFKNNGAFRKELEKILKGIDYEYDELKLNIYLTDHYDDEVYLALRVIVMNEGEFIPYGDSTAEIIYADTIVKDEEDEIEEARLQLTIIKNSITKYLKKYYNNVSLMEFCFV